MNRFPIVVCGLALIPLGACAPHSQAPQSAPAPTAAPPAAASPPLPAKHAKMICRNSQTGGKAECGTPNAVMVGIKEE